ncbi:UNKNOWN [Stylonychia lemnae]|uniref:Uncharacterized protein n=1 Tax=Stylonychia lemnae TaxID=5949 RepID=A0A077ZTW4_STYLE|nr:UNKNOWN [Stylonychia lemnae]|eukprot:CDW73333.1 UNKNOWN [Stylonychia lemnae]
MLETKSESSDEKSKLDVFQRAELKQAYHKVIKDPSNVKDTQGKKRKRHNTLDQTSKDNRKSKQFQYREPESPSMAQRKKKEHLIHERKMQLGGNNFEEEQQLILRDKKIYNHVVIDDIVNSEVRKCEIDLEECQPLLAQNTKTINHLEVNIRHLVKQKKARDEYISRINKMEEASKAIIASLKSGELLDPDNQNVPFQEQSVLQQLKTLRQRYNIKEVERDNQPLKTGQNGVIFSESLLSNKDLFLTYKKRKLMGDNTVEARKNRELINIKNKLQLQYQENRNIKKKKQSSITTNNCYTSAANHYSQKSEIDQNYFGQMHSRTSRVGSPSNFSQEFNTGQNSQRDLGNTRIESKRNSRLVSFIKQNQDEKSRNDVESQSYYQIEVQQGKQNNRSKIMSFRGSDRNVQPPNQYFNSSRVSSKENFDMQGPTTHKTQTKLQNTKSLKKNDSQLSDIIVEESYRQSHKKHTKLQTQSPNPQVKFEEKKSQHPVSHQMSNKDLILNEQQNYTVDSNINFNYNTKKNDIMQPRSKSVARQRYADNTNQPIRRKLVNNYQNIEEKNSTVPTLNLFNSQSPSRVNLSLTRTFKSNHKNDMSNNSYLNRPTNDTFFSLRKQTDQSDSIMNQILRKSLKNNQRGMNIMVNSSMQFQRKNQSLIDNNQSQSNKQLMTSNMRAQNMSINNIYQNMKTDVTDESTGEYCGNSTRNMVKQYLSNLATRPPTFNVNVLDARNIKPNRANSDLKRGQKNTSSSDLKIESSTKINNATFISHLENRSISTNRVNQKFNERTPSMSDKEYIEHIKSHPFRWQLQKNLQKIVDSRQEKRQVIEKILGNCNQIQEETEDQLQECEYKQLMNNLKIGNFKKLCDAIKEIEFADSTTLKVLYQYKQQSKFENEDNALEVQKEYKSGIMDPSRIAAQFERLMNVKKIVGKKKIVQENDKNYKQQRELKGLMSLC